MADWAKTDAETRKSSEQKMMSEWQVWLAAHADVVKLTEVGCKTKRVTSEGASDTRNDIVLYSVIEAESHELATKIFGKHPHLQIPQSSIEVMEVRPMQRM
jgi:hypothetical protein